MEINSFISIGRCLSHITVLSSDEGKEGRNQPRNPAKKQRKFIKRTADQRGEGLCSTGFYTHPLQTLRVLSKTTILLFVYNQEITQLHFVSV